ncbi:MAG: hypothetical protein PHU85_02835 [Phycisphaerae bacterium]|nr:hypothetical protein [Phycisphaerae bacterium]
MTTANRWLLAAVLALSTAPLPGCTGWDLTGKGGQDKPGDDSAAKPDPTGQWVVILDAFVGPARQQRADNLKNKLVARKWSGIGILHDSESHKSFVYYGPFKYGPQLDKALKDVRAYREVGGARIFPLAYQMELPPPNPPAPPEHNLFAAPRNAFWSLQIAHFVDSGPSNPATKMMVLPASFNRKKAAVEACADLRKQGYEAYYYHGQKMSLVTIGAFPADAFRFIDDPRKPRYEKYEPETDTYTDPRVAAIRDKKILSADGKEDQPFRYNLENGLKVIRVDRLLDGRVVRRPWPSFLVEIPRAGQDVE